MGRATQGVTIFKPAPGDAVSSIEAVSDLNLDEETDDPDENSKASTNGKATTDDQSNGTQKNMDGIE
jgi:hypothetical protein